MIENHQKQNKPQIYQIDAKGRPAGRVASEIAKTVQGKLNSNYRPEKLARLVIIVKNVSKMFFSGKKMKQKKYYHSSGYLGGLKIKKMEELFKASPEKYLLKVTANMLPKNKLRKKMLKNICFKKDK